MGRRLKAICNECGYSFETNEGGGFRFHLLRCDQCGQTKSIGFKEIGETHLRYLKGLSRPYSIVTSEHDKHVRETYPGKPLSENEYQQAVEALIGQCFCNGRFRLKAPMRCPQCKSTDVRKDKVTLLYD
jgi:predicted Zn-ribbon and HTH transcriptional regulator